MGKTSLKTFKVNYVIFLFTFMSLLNYSPTTSYACSCVEPNLVKDEVEHSAAVFSGKVIEIVDTNKNKYMQSSADPIVVLFEVEESWKGLNQTQVVVYTERSSASCGYEFTLNNEYLLYTHESNGALNVNICSRTTLLTSADKDFDELGKGEKPTEQVSIDLESIKGEENSTNNNQIYIISLIVALFLAVVFITRRIKNKQ